MPFNSFYRSSKKTTRIRIPFSTDICKWMQLPHQQHHHNDQHKQHYYQHQNDQHRRYAVDIIITIAAITEIGTTTSILCCAFIHKFSRIFPNFLSFYPLFLSLLKKMGWRVCKRSSIQFFPTHFYWWNSMKSK